MFRRPVAADRIILIAKSRPDTLATGGVATVSIALTLAQFRHPAQKG
jgi:hypothetical protein